ncbi:MULTISPECIES: IS21-like element helper ATPase IstB [unclassified Flavobacterium]|jgi:DNA replication protein DnaC|uniref:IS21-like element helper ATPase IstB n=1 Tax=unclassified Flavobacterium TaxID=196869 RepID=UPI0025BFDEA5|nr:MULTISPECIES: IS21-like element helper ATPase IstB [unclassified Flavobacterium]
MNTTSTIEKMQKLRLAGMKRAYESSFETRNQDTFTNDEFIAWLIESEDNQRNNSRTERLLKNARFHYQASIEEINYASERGLDRNLLTRLSDCSFIDRHENIIITGCTGTGKSYLATALGLQSCIKGYKVLYYNLGKLFHKLMIAKADGTYIKELAKIESHDLLILDDFGIQAIDQEKQMILMDLIEDRNQRKSTIFSSQIPVKNWYDLIQEKTIADAILDRIIHSAIRFELKGESMRKKMKNN